MTGTKIIKLKLDGMDALEGLPKLRDDSVVDSAYKKFLDILGNERIPEFRDAANDAMRGLNVRGSQLQMIYDLLEGECSRVSDFNSMAGLFLTSLMQNSTDKKFRLKINRPLNFLGNPLTGGKELTIEGDVGDATGAHMEDCKIRVNGSAGEYTGANMKRGVIEVTGYVDSKTGHRMEDGTINVGGDAGDLTGLDMKGNSLIAVGGCCGNSTGMQMKGGRLTVRKGVGNDTGTRMSGGEIMVGGISGQSTGQYMVDGRITVHGDTADQTGCGMKGGTIHVIGRARGETAKEMEGGKIEVMGGIDEISKEYLSGEIWENGNKVRG
ncbi:MAG: hypothetical protein V1921_06350 [Candidatus Altiarchaeota archaeon]